MVPLREGKDFFVLDPVWSWFGEWGEQAPLPGSASLTLSGGGGQGTAATSHPLMKLGSHLVKREEITKPSSQQALSGREIWPGKAFIPISNICQHPSVPSQLLLSPYLPAATKPTQPTATCMPRPSARVLQTEVAPARNLLLLGLREQSGEERKEGTWSLALEKEE